MEVNDQNVAQMAKYLGDTLDPNPSVRQPAEKSLQSVETNPGFSRLLLVLLMNEEYALPIRVAGSVTLKNFVKRNWKMVEEDKICDEDRQLMKCQIVELMLRCPDLVQKQISEVVSLIGLEDFPHKWQELLPLLVTHLASEDMRTVNSVLRTAHSLFKRYRFEMKSNKLWTEIKYVLDIVALPLTELFKKVVLLAQSVLSNCDASIVKPIFDCLTLIMKIFFSLNSQDLPEFFEDHMPTWMPGHLELLKLDPVALKNSDENEPGVVEQLRSQICDNITMYAQKYDVEFAPHLPPFVEVVWHLLVSTGLETRYDLLVSNAIQFLACVAERDQYRSLFEGQGTLVQICEKVVVPNMQFRPADLEMFEDNPDEFIRKDIEGSDADTRRRSAADFVKSLCKLFEPAIMQIFGSYIEQLLGSSKDNWQNKDAAVFLVTSLASRGQTARHGTTKTSELVPIAQFFNNHIKPDLEGEVNVLPVLKADALKFMVSFRQKLDKPTLLSCFPACIRLLTADSVVVHTYAAHTLERLFTMRDMNAQGSASQKSVVQSSDLQDCAEQLLGNLFLVLDKRGSTENEYAMKCIMRSLAVLQEASLAHASVILQRLQAKLSLVAKNPSKPHFNHYLFESLCVLIKQACKTDTTNRATQFENSLFPPFQQILQLDVAEFMPYVFQVLSMMLDLRGVQSGVPESYMALFPFLLMPALWERPGSVPGLVKLLQAYLKVGAAQVTTADQLNHMLGIFQRLAQSKSNDQYGFQLISSLYEHSKYETLESTTKGVFIILFKRLQTSKTAKFVRELIEFCCLFAIRVGTTPFINVVESIQPGMFGMLVEKVIIADVKKISGSLEKKICAVGITKMLTECPEHMVNGKYSNLWLPLITCLVSIFELPEEESADEEGFIDPENLPGYSAAYSQLAYAGVPENDPTGVPDPKVFLAKSLHKLSVNEPGKIGGLMQQMEARPQQFIQQYIQQAGLTVV